MGPLRHGAQLVNQPLLVGLVSGPHQHTNIVGHHGVLHPTLIKPDLSTEALACFSVAVMKLPDLSSSNGIAKWSLSEYLRNPCYRSKGCSFCLGSTGRQCLQVVLDNLRTKLAHGLAWLDVGPSLATLGAKCITT